MNCVFISYRRSDSAAYAGRVSDHFTALLGADRVFMDLDDLAPGEHFANAIDNALSQCSTVLVVIGPRWREILQERAASTNLDYVAHEIAKALDRQKKVVPVLVGGTRPDVLSNLPTPLTNLSFHQSFELRDSTFNDDTARLARALHLDGGARTRWRRHALVAAPIVVGALLLGGIAYRVVPFGTHRERTGVVENLLKTARTQAAQEEFQAAYGTYEQVLAQTPTNTAALDGQLDAAMKWLQNFHVLAGEGQKAEEIAAPMLARITQTLEAGLARTSGKDRRAADIVAHLGWAHWLNERIAFKEFGNAERYFRQALRIDSTSVFANAYLGGWLLQSSGDSREALEALHRALAAKEHRELVRGLQLGGLRYKEDPGMREELVRALNDARLNQEIIATDEKSRLTYLYSPSDPERLQAAVQAVRMPDAWETYRWIVGDGRSMMRDSLVHAMMLDSSGDSATALSEYRSLASLLKKENATSRVTDYVSAAIKRLSK